MTAEVANVDKEQPAKDAPATKDAAVKKVPGKETQKESDKSSKDRLPSVGDVIRSEQHRLFKLNAIIGEGGYGTVYECLVLNGETKRRLACKAEKWSKTVLKIEISVLRAANAKHCKHFCDLLDYGRVPQEYMFIVVSLLDRDINRLRNEQPDRHFTIGTAARVGMQTCSAIEELHSLGFLSRDIKAGNFGIGRREDQNQRLVFMFDFGLSRKYVDKNKNVIPPRKDIGWRGTTRYGSLQAHRKQDLGRRDDMESWLYMLIEISKGHLPWRMVTDRHKVYECKLACREDFRAALFGSLPKQFDELLTQIDKLTFEAQPHYADFVKLLAQVCEDHSIDMNQPYDWEVEPPPSSVHTSATKSVDNSASEEIKANNVERPSRPEIP
ncbi:hypothetical protein L596_017890 [Steinernema carpocapsae]|uniref:Protein kinase domain-containing protein n=1 Tax=Steinernema carpocapsae TaxID=34508 RepID=A0A4U5N3E3_STECR|nr:hypothetical protein L596_017890 [Steinernema carpocapsae]